MDCSERNRPVPDNTATETKSFIYLCLGGEKNGHTAMCVSKETHQDVVWPWTVDHGPWTVDPGTATEPPPHTFHSPGAASLWIGSSSLRGGKPNLTREVSIHTNSRLTAMVVSKLIRRFDAERRVHLLLIRPDRFFTSASSVHTFSPFRRRSASERHGLGCISVPTTGRGWSGRRGTF